MTTVSRRYLYYKKPAVLCSGTISAIDETTVPFRTLTLSVTTGSLSATTTSGLLTISFGTNSSAGLNYISGYDYGSSKITIAATPVGVRDGETNLEVGTTFEIWDDYRFWALHPRIDAIEEKIYKDYDIQVAAGTNFAQYIRPIPNGGPAQVALLSSGTASVDFDKSTYLNLDDQFTGAPTIAWTFPSATPSSSSSDQPTGVEWSSAGLYWCTKSATYTTPAVVSGTRKVPVLIEDLSNLLSREVDRAEIEWSVEEGSRLTVSLSSDFSDVPPGSLGIFWRVDWVGSVQQAPVVEFIGWEDPVSSSIAGTEFGTTLPTADITFLDIKGWLEKRRAEPQVVTPAAVPATWYEMYKPTIAKLIDYLLRWHSTATYVSDFIVTGVATTYEVPTEINTTEADFAAQARQIADHIAYASTAELDQLKVVLDPQLQWPDDRASGSALTLTNDDFSEISYERRAAPVVGLITSSGFEDGSDLLPHFVRAPGTVRGQGPGTEEYPQQLVDSVVELQRRTGARYARVNAPVPLIGIELTSPDDPGIRPANLPWVSFTHSETYAGFDGQTYSTKRMQLRSLTMSVEGTEFGTTAPRWAMELEPEITVVVEAVVDEAIPPEVSTTAPEQTGQYRQPAENGGFSLDFPGTIFAVTTREVARTDNPGSSTNWTTLFTRADLSIGNNVVFLDDGAKINPHNESEMYLAVGQNDAGDLSGEPDLRGHHIFSITGLDQGAGNQTFTSLYNNAPLGQVSNIGTLVVSEAIDGMFYVHLHKQNPSENTVLGRASTSESVVEVDNVPRDEVVAPLDIDVLAGNPVLVPIFLGDGTGEMYIADGPGFPFSQQGGFTDHDVIAQLEHSAPWARQGAARDLVYAICTGEVGSGYQAVLRLFRYEDGVWSDIISPVLSNGQTIDFLLVTFTFDTQPVMYASRVSKSTITVLGARNGVAYLCQSPNRGQNNNWTIRELTGVSANVNLGLFGWPYDDETFFITDGSKVWYTSDAGATLIEITGDLSVSSDIKQILFTKES